MAWQDWVNVFGDVASVVARLAPLFEDEDAAGGPAQVQLGNLLVDRVVENGEVRFYASLLNPSKALTVAFAGVSESSVRPSASAETLLVEGKSKVDITRELNDFATGSFSAVPRDGSGLEGLERAISYAIYSISTATAISIVGGISGRWNRPSGDGWELALETSKGRIVRGTASVTVPGGLTVTAQGSSKPSEEAVSAATFVFPSDFPVSPIVEALVLELTVDDTLHSALVARD